MIQVKKDLNIDVINIYPFKGNNNKKNNTKCFRESNEQK